MLTSLTKVVNHLSETYGKKYRVNNCQSELEFKGFKNNNFLAIAKSVEKITKSINGLIKKFPNTYKFCNNDINKFILLLRKGGYPYEYMDSWGRFNETTLTNKKAFYGKLYLELHPQKVFEELKLENLGDYRDLYVQSDALLLTGACEIF